MLKTSLANLKQESKQNLMSIIQIPGVKSVAIPSKQIEISNSQASNNWHLNTIVIQTAPLARPHIANLYSKFFRGAFGHS